MKLEDFTEQEQQQIKKGLTFSVISDKRKLRIEYFH